MSISSLMDACATFDCYLSITKKFEWMLKKKAFFGVTAFFISATFIFKIFYHFTFSIAYQPAFTFNYTYPDGITKSFSYEGYFLRKISDFAGTPAYKAFNILDNSLRDIGILVVLLILNFMILCLMRKSTQRRMKMAAHGQNASEAAGKASVNVTANRAIRTAQRAERRKVYMILATGISFFFGHICNAIYYIMFNFKLNNFSSAEYFCFSLVAEWVLKLSYAVPSFFIYYFFNSHFNRFANDDFLWLIKPIYTRYKRNKELKLTRSATGGGVTTMVNFQNSTTVMEPITDHH